MNIGEWGNTLRINVKEDISSRINTLELLSPTPVVKVQIITSAEGLSVGGSDLTVGGETYLANQYIEYDIAEGDIFISGDWETRVHSKASDSSNNKITDKLSFVVDP